MFLLRALSLRRLIHTREMGGGNIFSQARELKELLEDLGQDAVGALAVSC